MQPALKNSVFRDNIRGNRLVSVSKGVTRIIDCRAFQRLRHIRQMGLSSYVFPTAEHSRFAHSVGVYATALEAFRALQSKAASLTIPFPGMRFDEEAEDAFCIAAMCHDIGHTAFSHALEEVLLPHGMKRHESSTLALIRSDPDLAGAIQTVSDLESVILFIEKEHPNRALSQLISGPFDVDRCDYLVRDSQSSGVYYGQYDFTWLLHAMSVMPNEMGQPVLLLDGPRGLDALRQFLAARRYMHRQVYFHPTIRAAQILLRGIFERIMDTEVRLSIINSAPKGLRNLLQRQPITLDDLVRTTDNEVLYLIRLLEDDSTDPVLVELSRMFGVREFPKAVVDSAKSHVPIREIEWGHGDLPVQRSFWREQDPVQIAKLVEECRSLVGLALKAEGRPEELARYLVAYERVRFRSDPPTDFAFRYGDATVSLSQIDHEEAGYNVPKLMETFQIYRLFAPGAYKDRVIAHVSQYKP